MAPNSDILSAASNAEAARLVGAAEATPRISEDWLSVVIGLAVFALALVSLAGADLLGWVVTTSVWTDPGKALGTVSKIYAELGGAGALIVTYLALLVVLSAGRGRAEGRRAPLCRRLHGGVLDRLCELDRRQLRPSRGGHARRSAEIRHRLVAQAHQRRRLHRRAPRRPRHRQFLSALRRMAARRRSGPSSTSRSRS